MDRRRPRVRVLVRLLAVLGLVQALTPAPAGAVKAEDLVFGYGDVAGVGSTADIALDAPVVGIAPTATGRGYWLLAGDGGVFGFGDASSHGSTRALRLNQPIAGMAGDPKGRGYWFTAMDGGVFAFDTPFFGSMAARRLNEPVVGMASTGSGQGYWLVARDGGVFAFGDARFAGSTGHTRLNHPVVGMAADPDGSGYWLAAADGGVFAFDAAFAGSATTKLSTSDRVTGIAAAPKGMGYWLVTATGKVLAFGQAESFGDAVSEFRTVPAIAASPTGAGYWLAANPRLSEPPRARLTGPQDSITASFRSSCWAIPPDQSRCTESAGFATDASILNVRRGDVVTVRFQTTDSPLGARVFDVDAPPTDAGVRALAATNPTAFPVDLPVGFYRMGLSSTWVQGATTHSFRLNVR